jgi:hypothetical protein
MLVRVLTEYFRKMHKRDRPKINIFWGLGIFLKNIIWDHFASRHLKKMFLRSGIRRNFSLGSENFLY